MTDNNFKNIPLFQGCKSSFIDTLQKHAQYQTHEKGKILFINDEKADRFYFIKNGWVKLFRETLDGAQAVIDILPAGKIFGETSIFENNTYPYSAEVIESSEIISMPIANLKAEIEHNNTMALNMLRSITNDRQRQDKQIEHLSLQNAPQRIGCFLLRLANQNTRGPITIHLPYDKTLVASRLGMQPETFSRALARLSRDTGIRIKGATIELDQLEQLACYSCSACSSSFPCKNL